jgi:hypothetical protein
MLDLTQDIQSLTTFRIFITPNDHSAIPPFRHPLPFRLTFGIIRLCLDLTGLFRN